MEEQILKVLKNFWESVSNLCVSLIGQLWILITVYWVQMDDIYSLWVLIIIACTWDFWSGYKVSKKRKQIGFLSGKFRETWFKLALYLSLITFFFFAEKEVGSDWYVTSRVLFAIACGVEIGSILANSIILYPALPFLRIFARYFTSEIAHKLNIPAEEVEKILNEYVNTDYRKKQTKDAPK